MRRTVFFIKEMGADAMRILAIKSNHVLISRWCNCFYFLHRFNWPASYLYKYLMTWFREQITLLDVENTKVTNRCEVKNFPLKNVLISVWQ